jgi:hypothetical protein
MFDFVRLESFVDDHNDNPYSPPRVESPRVEPPAQTSSSSRDRKPRRFALLLGSLIFVLSLLTAFCVFWFAAAVWEIVNLQEDDYGQHTPMFRASYIRSGAKAFILGSISLLSCLWLQRRINRGV